MRKVAAGMTARIHRHAGLLALLAAVAFALAAPYLVPENPDSAVFRSGAVGLLLTAAAFVPAREGLRRADARALAASCAVSLLFACSLSLGAELRVYGALLRGMGSFLRRAAVPLLAAPLLTGLCARVMTLRLPEGRGMRWPMRRYMALLLLCWTPALLANFPGLMNYDFMTEFCNYAGGYFNKRHPMLYFLIQGALMDFGRLFREDYTVGFFLCTLARMLALAASLAYSCVFAQRRNVPRWACAALLLFYAFMPVFPLLAVSTSKDTVFSAALLALSLLSWEAVETPEAFFASKKKLAAYGASVLLTAHLRNNGLIAFVLLFPLVLGAMKGFRKRMAKLMAAACAASLALMLALELAFPLVAQPSAQLYSLPAQQLVRAYALGDLTEEECAEIEYWYEDSFGLILRPQLADGAKGYLDLEKLEGHGGEYMALWARIGKRCPRVYLEAFLLLNLGLWYPDDVSHTMIYDGTGGTDRGYLELQEYTLDPYGVHVEQWKLLPGVYRLMEAVCRDTRYLKTPLGVLLCTAAPFWALVFAAAMLMARGRGKPCAALGGVLAVWLSYFFGPCTLARYVLPLFCLAPVVMIMAFLAEKKEI